MKIIKLLAAAVVLMPLLAPPAGAADDMLHSMQTAIGNVLTDTKGMTLYTFDGDSAGKSACAGPCAQNWPPLTAVAGAKPQGDWTVVGRDDGGSQWAYKGKPLYAFAKDQKPGDTAGEGVKGMWHVAKP
jgi:predicted lipoprotein with Yx(FWY)xxD motif